MKIGIDLGTCNSVVFLPRKGIVLEEPSVVAVSLDNNKILAVGKEAKAMIGRTPDIIRVYRPLRDGVIADFRVTQAIIRYFIEKVSGRFRFFKPELLIGVPAGASSTERRALIEAGLLAGAKEVFLAKEPILAALGSGIPIESYSGNMIVDIGGGRTEAAVISLGGIVTVKSVRVGGDKMDFAISEYIKKKHNLAIGEQMAEKIKIKIGTSIPEKEERKMEIRGRGLVSGLPCNIEVSSNEVREAVADPLAEIIQIIKQLLRDTPPELSADIMSKGLILSGGGSLLRGMAKLVTESVGVPATLSKDALLSVAKGTGIMLNNLDAYKRVILSKR